MWCHVLEASFHFNTCWLSPLNVSKACRRKSEEWEDGKARAQGARSGGDTNQFSKILGSGNKGILGGIQQ